MPRAVYKKTNKKVCLIGVDALNFEMVIDGVSENKYLKLMPLINMKGREFGNLEMKQGKVYIYINLPTLIRKNNINPFYINDIPMLETINIDIEQTLKKVLKGIVDDNTDILSAKAKSIECNITRRVAGDSSCSQALNLINRSFYEGTNVVYQRASSKCRHLKEDETVIIRKKNYYIIKCYDKSLQQRKLGNKEVENGLLRLEVVMQDRIIKNLFVEKSTIRDVLTEKGIIKIIEEYKRIFIGNIIEEHIKPCLRNVTNILFESLKETKSPVKTISLYKELIMDEEILRTALKKWYKSIGSADYSRQQIYYIQEEHKFPKDVIKTLVDFKLFRNEKGHVLPIRQKI